MIALREEFYQAGIGMTSAVELVEQAGEIKWIEYDGAGVIVSTRAVTPSESDRYQAFVARQNILAVQESAIGEFKTLTMLAGKTDAQISAWVDANVADAASIKKAIKLLARAVGALARERGW